MAKEVKSVKFIHRRHKPMGGKVGFEIPTVDPHLGHLRNDTSQILLSLMPDDFTRQLETRVQGRLRGQWVN